jgi:tRNA(Ile)-lysidine synthase
MPTVSRLRAFVERHNLLEPGSPVVVGVSGGPDSLCLLHLLMRLGAPDQYDLSLHVAHLNHRLRGEASDADAAFVSRLAGDWGLPITVEAADVKELARQRRLSIEEAARQARYSFLARAAAQAGAQTIAVAHNADDQAETVLMHFLRGSGVAGLRGIRPKSALPDWRLEIGDWRLTLQSPTPSAALRGRSAVSNLYLVRPLLETTRADVEAYCAEHGLEPRLDQSNFDTTLFRNRLRHEVLPALEAVSPGLRTRLRRMAEVMAGEHEVLQRAVESARALALLAESATGVTLDLAAFRLLPTGIQRALLRDSVSRLRADLRDVDFVPVEAAVRLAASGQTGARAPLPGGLSLSVGHSTIVVRPENAPPDLPDIPLLSPGARLDVSLPGRTALPHSDWLLESKVLPPGNWRLVEIEGNLDEWQAFLDWDVVRGLGADATGRLALRSRQPGDRFQPQGMGGAQPKLSEFMTAQKVPAPWRDRVPLLIAGDDQIVWMCGWRVSEAALVTPETREVLRLRWVKGRR